MVTVDAIMAVLRTIDDPEMPITIVDLGIVEDVRIGPLEDDDGEDSPSDTEASRVRIKILPTFVGCPALPMLRKQICEDVGRLQGVGTVEVEFVFDPPWSVDRISDAGRASLKAIGVTVPPPDAEHDQPIGITAPYPTACPFCDSADITLESPFGPTRCRMIFYCNKCKNPFEHMKRI